MEATSGPHHPKIRRFNQQNYSITNIILIIKKLLTHATMVFH